MRVPRKNHEKVREKILQSARVLFNRHGFNAVSIDDVMSEAGLTRGSFYSYFDSKTELYAQAVSSVVCEKRDGAAGQGQIDAEQIVRDYLSVQHLEDIDGGCPMIGLPSDISRTSQSVRQAFESALRLMIEVIEQDVRTRTEPDRNRILSIAALCVGGMVLARSIDNREFANELREAAMATALSLGNWQ